MLDSWGGFFNLRQERNKSKNEFRIYFWRGLASCVGFSFLIVFTKEEIRVAFYIFLCWKNILRKTDVGKEKLGSTRLPPEQRLAPSESSAFTLHTPLLQTRMVTPKAPC